MANSALATQAGVGGDGGGGLLSTSYFIVDDSDNPVLGATGHYVAGVQVSLTNSNMSDISAAIVAAIQAQENDLTLQVYVI